MEWKEIKNYPVVEYDWVILGYLDDQNNMAWQIGRCIDDKLEFFVRDIGGGPYAGDSIYPFKAEQATHWLEVPYV